MLLKRSSVQSSSSVVSNGWFQELQAFLPTVQQETSIQSPHKTQQISRCPQGIKRIYEDDRICHSHITCPTYVLCLHAVIHDEITLQLYWKTSSFSSMEACRSSPVLCLKKCAATKSYQVRHRSTKKHKRHVRNKLNKIHPSKLCTGFTERNGNG